MQGPTTASQLCRAANTLYYGVPPVRGQKVREGQGARGSLDLLRLIEGKGTRANGAQVKVGVVGAVYPHPPLKGAGSRRARSIGAVPSYAGSKR
jgi:hypothetical protein